MQVLLPPAAAATALVLGLCLVNAHPTWAQVGPRARTVVRHDARTPATSEASDARLGVDKYLRDLLQSLEGGPREPQPITLRSAIRTAIANNPGILAGGRERELARQRVLQALAVFDPVLNSLLLYEKENVQTPDVLQGSGGNLPPTQTPPPDERTALDILRQQSYGWDFKISKLLQYGTSLDIDFTNDRNTSSAARFDLNPFFQPELGLAVRQPIFRNFAGLDARTTVLVARNSSKRSVAEFEAELADFATAVVRAYWDQVLARAELEVSRTSLRLAEELVTEAQARVKIGTLPPVAIKEARADAAAREEAVINAQNVLDLASRTLQYTVMLGIAESGPLPVTASDVHVPTPISLSRSRSATTAVERRAEVRAARLDLASAALDVKRAHSLLLPGLDFIIDWSFVGLAGRERNPAARDLALPGGYGDALSELSTTDFYRFFVGVEIDVPFSNIEAKSRLDDAEIEAWRERDELREVVSEIALEVEDAVGDVASALKRVAAARLARELAEENLRDQRKRYDVGMVTTTDILRFQDSLASAMAAEARAISDHAVATAELKRAEGTLLDEYGIDVSFEDQPDEPWWVRF